MTGINVVCVLWGSAYPANSVTSLFHQVSKNIGVDFSFHIFTEEERQIDSSFHKHSLQPLEVGAPWWHKISVFDPQRLSGPTLYLDLDLVIARDLTWITHLPTDYLWAIKDYRYLWDSSWMGYNSSVMWFDPQRCSDLYTQFNKNKEWFISRYRGDQDYITASISESGRRFFPESQMPSWRWQCWQGGWDHATQKFRQPGLPTNTHDASIVVFHGQPKPWDCGCEVISRLRDVE